MYDDGLREISEGIDRFVPPPIDVEPHSNVSLRLAERGLSRPRISTVLRKWALAHPDVRRLDLYHTGQTFSVAVLLNSAPVDHIRELNKELRSLLSAEFGDDDFETYIVGNAHQDAAMFHRYAAISIILPDALKRQRAA
jgi:hypothetical protein